MRSVDEWEGKDDDTLPPPRVQLRVFTKHEGKCGVCGQKIMNSEWELDHIIALAIGGKNAESNLQPVHFDCHKTKTAEDVGIKSKIYRIRAKHLGITLKRKRKFGFG